MKICIIGDPHGDIEKIKQIPLDSSIDLILLTGDIGDSSAMRNLEFNRVQKSNNSDKKVEFDSKAEKEAFMKAFNSSIEIIKYLLRFAPVKTIYGNVEMSNYDTKEFSKKIGVKLPYLSNELKKLGVDVCNNTIRTINTIKIGFLKYFIDTNWVESFCPNDEIKMKIAKKQSQKAKKVLDWFSYIDILICHQPPYNILDIVNSKNVPKSWNGKSAGSKIILEYIYHYCPKYVFCGHIHEGEGEAINKETQVYNLGTCNFKIIEI